MKLTSFRSIAISSLLIASSAVAATRPHYGGTLHIETAESISTLDPSDSTRAYTLASHNVLALIFDTLVVLDDRGQPRTALAISWESDPGNRRWQFVLRPGVRFSDQTSVTPEAVAASLAK